MRMNYHLKIIRSLIVWIMLLTPFGFAQMTVVSTLHPYHDLVRQIGGEAINAVRLLPPGASPHTFDPTPRDIARVAEAELIIINGGQGMDEWVNRLILASGSKAPIIRIIEEVSFEGVTSSIAEGSDSGFVNPHIWLDPIIMIEASRVIAAALGTADPNHASAYEQNAATLISKLEQLHTELEDLLSDLQDAAFVPFHDAWPYFTRRYGLNLVVEIEPFPGREPSPRYLQYALGEIKMSGAKAIFTEPQLSVRPAEIVAEQAGLPLYSIDPLGSDQESYQSLMRRNAEIILQALGQP